MSKPTQTKTASDAPETPTKQVFLDLAIETVKHEKAKKLFWQDVETYGNEGHALRALDCKNRDEAIAMLAAVQTVRIFKQDGKIVLQ